MYYDKLKCVLKFGPHNVWDAHNLRAEFLILWKDDEAGRLTLQLQHQTVMVKMLWVVPL